MNKGKIIVVEGTDKAGKGTQSKLLINALKLSGRICTIMDFPDYTTPIGQEIRAFLDGRRNYAMEVKHMLLSANRWEKKDEIESMLKKDTIIIMNRYYQSNIVYGVSHDLSLKWLLNLDKGLPKEDVVIVLEVNPNTSYQRVPGDRDTFEMDQKLLMKVHKNYRKLAKQFNWKVVNGEKVSEQVHNKIMNIVRNVLKV
ncbi:MAG TPA: dTMP kinase [Nitrososphaeraceae archaeon]|nr:dTMP kinase [Thermoproteota archaeon]HZA62187.1 dTMP kinase [Nitrososphaeraceae archaeon]HZA68968.1 dTMP kinase [Nitrososphaeraceae archaeon]